MAHPPNGVSSSTLVDDSSLSSPRSLRYLHYHQSSASMAEEWKDLIIEILLRLPAESVARFKFVCKNWYDLIRSPYFTNLYENRNLNPTKKKVSLYCRSCDLLPCGTRTIISFRFYDKIVGLNFPVVAAKSLKIVGCSNGVVCLALSDKQDEFLIWNPATNELKRIPKPLNLVIKWSKTKSTSGFWFDHADNSFKLARVEFGNSNAQKGNVAAQVCIFSSIDNSWRLKEFVLPDVPICKCIKLQTKTGVNMCEEMHVLVTGGIDGVKDGVLLDHTCIVCFDMVEEVFKRVDLPPYFTFIQLASYKGESLVMFVMREGGRAVYFDMLVMNDCDGRNQAWTSQQTFRDLHLPLGFYGEDENNWKLLHYVGSEPPYRLYDEETGKSEAFSASERPYQLFAYHETLAPVN